MCENSRELLLSKAIENFEILNALMIIHNFKIIIIGYIHEYSWTQRNIDLI